MFKDSYLPDYVLSAIERLEKSGFSAYVVGGAVRDIIMGKKPEDFDITTKAHPDDVLKLFSDLITIETGRRFGTITVIAGGNPLEITTFRSDGDYLNSRSPEKVFYSNNVEEDLKRRDFTINAIAYSVKGGLVDLFGGREDIENKIIRTIGCADERFSEDALRILRALRFSSTLDFCIDKETEESILKNKELLKNISKERIHDELNKIISGKNSKPVFLRYRSVFEVFIPELKGCSEKEYVSAVNILSMPDTENDTALKLSILLSFLDADTAGKILKRLKYDNKTVKEVKLLLSHLYDSIGKSKPELKLLLEKLGKENTKKLLLFKELCGMQTEEVRNAKRLLDEIFKNNECYSLKGLKIKGNDLISIGMSGSDIGKALRLALNQVINERVENQKDLLIDCIVDKFKN